MTEYQRGHSKTLIGTPFYDCKGKFVDKKKHLMEVAQGSIELTTPLQKSVASLAGVCWSLVVSASKNSECARLEAVMRCVAHLDIVSQNI